MSQPPGRGLSLAILMLSAGASAEGGGGADAGDLLRRAFEHLYSDDYVQTLELVTQTPASRPLRRTAQILRKQRERPGKVLVRFLEPYDVRRTAVLILENEGSHDDMWVYVPALRRTRRLSAAQRADAFFGTDLWYEDIEPKRTDDYDVEFADGGREGEGCVRLEVRAREGVDSSYDRMLSCVDPERGILVWSEFHRRGQLVKRLDVDLAEVREVEGRLIPYLVTFHTPRTGSTTRVATQHYQALPSIPDALFSTRNLEAGDAERDRRRASP